MHGYNNSGLLNLQACWYFLVSTGMKRHPGPPCRKHLHDRLVTLSSHGLRMAHAGKHETLHVARVSPAPNFVYAYG
jgi:hypothetical protein